MKNKNSQGSFERHSRKNIKTFKGAGYAEMFHEIASSAYDSSKLYTTGNGRSWCLLEPASNKVLVFFGGVVVATIDKTNETVESLSMYWFGNGLDNLLWSLGKAFDHYKKITVTAFNIGVGQILEAMESYEFPKNRVISVSLEHVAGTAAANNITGSPIIQEADKRRLEREERERKQAEEREKERQAYLKKQKETVEGITPWFQQTVAFCNSNYQKLKKLNDFRLSCLKLQEIPEECVKYFHVNSWTADKPTDEQTWSLDVGIEKEAFAPVIGIRTIDRYHYRDGLKHLPDGITLVKGILLTTQGCQVKVTKEFKVLYKKLMKMIQNKEDVSDYLGTSIGDYCFGGVDYAEKYIRVGCHCFLFEDVMGLANEINQVKCE